MNAEELYLNIYEFCKSNADESLVKKYSRYFKEGSYNAWGLTRQIMEKKRNDLLHSGALSIDLIFQTAPLLMRNDKYEETSFAITLLNSYQDHFTKEIFERLDEWFEHGITNWAHADTMGMLLLPIFLKKRVITEKDFIPWITSPYEFKRRCVPVTYIKSLKEYPLQELLCIIDPLMSDTERVVHQGVGWFLREAWKKFPEQTEEYMLKYKDTSPRLIFQYACEKMTTENKGRFKKSQTRKDI